MTHEPTPLSPELHAWLARADHPPAREWQPEPPRAELRCDPALVARLAEVTRPIGPVGRHFVDGAPVIHHPGGRPIAAAARSAWLVVRSGLAPGTLAPRSGAACEPDIDADLTALGWVELEPWGVDIAFARVVDLLRHHADRAYADAERDG